MAYWVAPNQTQCNPQPLSERCPTNLHGLDQGDVSRFQSVEGGDSSLQSRNGFGKVTFTLILDGLGCSCCLVSHCLVSSNHLHNQSPDEECSKHHLHNQSPDEDCSNTTCTITWWRLQQHHLHNHLMKTAATPPTQSPDEDCSNTTYTVTWWRLQQHHLHSHLMKTVATPPAQSPDEDCSNTTCTITWWRLQQHHLHSHLMKTAATPPTQSPDEDCSNTTCTISHLVKTAATPPAQSVTWWRLQQHHMHNQSPGEDCSNTTCTISHLVKTAATPPAQSVTWWRLVKTLPTSPNFKLFTDCAWSNFEFRCLCKIHNKNKQITTHTKNPTPTPAATKNTITAANAQHWSGSSAGPAHLFLGLHLHCVLLNLHHQLLRFLRGFDQLWLQIRQLLLHDGDLGGSKVQFLQPHQVAVLHLGDIRTLQAQQFLECQDQL